MFNGGAAPPERGQFLDFLRSAEAKPTPFFAIYNPIRGGAGSDGAG
jgi:hypothetical protein